MCLASDHTCTSAIVAASRGGSGGGADVLNSHSWSSTPPHSSGFGTVSIWFKYFVSGCGGLTVSAFFLGGGGGGAAAALTTGGGLGRETGCFAGTGIGIGIGGGGGGGLVAVTGGDWAVTWFVFVITGGGGDFMGEGLWWR